MLASANISLACVYIYFMVQIYNTKRRKYEDKVKCQLTRFCQEHNTNRGLYQILSPQLISKMHHMKE